MRLITLLPLITTLLALHSMGQNFPWSAFFGNEGAEFAYDIRQTTDSGYIVAAYASNGGISDFYVVRLDPFGDLAWEKTISKDNYSERAFNILETPEGDFIAVGNATNFTKPWLVRLNASGDTVWTTQWTDTIFNNSGLLSRGALLPDGRIAVVSHTDYYALDPYMFIVGPDGELLEERDLESLVPLGWFSGTTILDIEPTSDGGFIVTGGAGGGTGSRAFLWKFDANADSSWSVIYDGAAMRYAQSVKQLSDGGYILTGATAPNTTATAALLTDADGNLVWFQSYPDTLYTNGTDVIEWKSGEFLISEKRFQGFGATFFESALLRIDSLGTLLARDPVIGSDSSTTITQLRRTSDGGFVLAGEINEYLSVGEQDLFVLKSDPLGNIAGVTIDYVWPGDVNYDGTVDMQDLMILGVTAGASGPAREDTTIGWYPHYVTDWADTVVTGVNFKHADTDGNGMVEILDTLAIMTNYGSTHSYATSKSGSASGDDLYVDPALAVLTDGQHVALPVFLGKEETPVEALYGLSFRMLFNEEVIESSSLSLDLEGSWLGMQSEDLWSLEKTHLGTGATDFGITRSDHQPVSGHGMIGLLFFSLAEPLLPGGSITTTLEFIDLHAHQYDLQQILLGTSAHTLTLANVTTTINSSENVAKNIRVYPNPVASGQQIHITSPDRILSITVFDMHGKEVMRKEITPQAYTYQLQNLTERGMYLVRIETRQHIVHKRILVSN